MLLSFRQKPKCIVSLLLLCSLSCREDNKDSPVSEVPPPNTCKAMVNLGTWPGPGSVETWVYGCFEGYEVSQGIKSYLAGECKEATNVPGFELVNLDSPTCPMEGATSVCEGSTFKVVAYQQDPKNFDIEKFKKYCESKSGQLKIL